MTRTLAFVLTVVWCWWPGAVRARSLVLHPAGNIAAPRGALCDAIGGCTYRLDPLFRLPENRWTHENGPLPAVDKLNDAARRLLGRHGLGLRTPRMTDFERPDVSTETATERRNAASLVEGSAVAAHRSLTAFGSPTPFTTVLLRPRLGLAMNVRAYRVSGAKGKAASVRAVIAF